MNTSYQDPQAPPAEAPARPSPAFENQPSGYQPPPMLPQVEEFGPTSIGLRANVAAALSYLWVVGLVFFILEKRNLFVRFHALQGLLWGITNWIVVTIFAYMPSYLSPLSALFSVIWLVVAVLTAVRAYRGQWRKLPLVGDTALDHAMKWTPQP